MESAFTTEKCLLVLVVLAINLFTKPSDLGWTLVSGTFDISTGMMGVYKLHCLIKGDTEDIVMTRNITL